MNPNLPHPNRRWRLQVFWVVASVAVSLPIAASADEDSTAATTPAATEDAKPTTTIAWKKDLKTAKSAAKAAQRPVLVDFTASWCGPCKKLDRETFAAENVIRYLRDRYVAVKVDIDESPEIAKQYEVSAVPTIVLLSSEGTELRRFSGFRPADGFLEEVNKAYASSAAFETLKKAAADAPSDINAQRAYARALIAASNHQAAIGVLRAALERAKDDAGLLLELGGTYLAAGKLKEAEAQYRALVAGTDPTTADTRRAGLLPLARCLSTLGDTKGSIDAATRFLNETAKSTEKSTLEARLQARFLRGYGYSILKESAKAILDLKAVEEESPTSAWGLRASYILDLIGAES